MEDDMPGDSLYSDEQQRISKEFHGFITDDVEVARHDEADTDYHMHAAVHEGEQFFFANAYNRGEEHNYGIKSTARRFDAGLEPAVLDETGSKSERKKKRQAYEAAKKKWEEAGRRQVLYDAANAWLESKIVSERMESAKNGEDVLSVPKDYEAVMAADVSEDPALAVKQAEYQKYGTDPRYQLLLREENRWIGIALVSRTEEEMDRLPEEERAGVAEADAFYEEMFAGINRARDFMAAGYAVSGGRDAESQKIYGRLTRRLAEASNSYALNEREVKARQKISLEISSAPGFDRESVLLACQSKAKVQEQIRFMLREEIRRIVRLIEIAQNPDADVLTDGDERYLSLNGIETEDFRKIRERRERHAADIERDREEAEQRRLEEERRIEEQRRAEAEAERKRLLEAAAAAFKGDLDERLEAVLRYVADLRSDLLALKQGATREAAETVNQLADLKREIDEFLVSSGYEGELKEAFGASAAAAEGKRIDVAASVSEAFGVYRLRTKETHGALQDDITETRVDFLVDAEASEYCDEFARAEFDLMIDDEINNDAELRKVTDGLNADLRRIRDVLDRARDTTDENDRKIDREERIEYMKKLDAALTDLEKRQAELRSLEVDDGAGAEERKRELHTRLFEKRVEGYGAAVTGIRENIATLVFAKYGRAIRRRTDIERNLPKTANAIMTERIERASMSDKDVNGLLERISKGRVTDDDIGTLRENFALFLTKKYRGNEQLDARLDRVVSGAGSVREEDRAALSAAVRYIITTDRQPDLKNALETASNATLEELRQELGALNSDVRDGLKISSREGANNIGAKLGALKRIARKNLIASDFATFEEELNAASRGCLPGMKEQLGGADAYTKHEYLDRLLMDAELHPGVLWQLRAMTPQAQESLLKRIYEDREGALAAIDEFLIGREDLDDLALVLKAKALKLHAEPEGDPDGRKMYSMTAGHDALRLVRSCRGFIRDVKKKRPGDLALIDRLEQMEALDDRALVETLLRGKAAGNLPGMQFMYLNTYALMLSAEKGAQVSAGEVQATEAGKGFTIETIEAALTSGLASREQYDKAAVLLKTQADVYNGERLGNRVMNFFGDLIGRDLSRERLGLRALNGLIDLEDQAEARELQMALARDVYKTKLAHYDPANVNLLRKITENTHEGYFIKDDLGHQLALAAGASLYKEKKTKEEAARAEAVRRRRQERIDGRQKQIDELRTRDGEARSVYDEASRKAIDGLLDARDRRRDRLLENQKSPAVRGSAHIALSVLVMQALFAKAQELMAEAANGVTKDRAAGLTADWKEITDAARALSAEDKGFGKYFSLSTMTKETEKTKDQIADADKARAVALRTLFAKLTEIRDVRKATKEDLGKILREMAQAAEQVFEEQDGLTTTERAKAALLLDMEDHGINPSDVLLGIFGKGSVKGESVTNELMFAAIQNIPDLLGKSRLVRKKLMPDDRRQALRDARLRRAAALGEDPDRTIPGSSELALIVFALNASLAHLTDASDRNWRHYAGVIGKLAEKNEALLGRFNLRAMTDEGKADLDENDMIRRDDFMRRIKAVINAGSNESKCRAAAVALDEFMNANSMLPLANAALLENSVPLTKEKLDAQVDGIVADTAEKTALKGLYRGMFDKRMEQLKAGGGKDERSGAQLVEDARLARRDAGIEDDETGAVFALTLTAMHTLSAMIPTQETDTGEEWSAYREALDALRSRLPKEMNLLAITADGKDSSILPEIKAINENFVALLSFAARADNRNDFYSGMKNLTDFFDLYHIGKRADAVIRADAHLTKTGREADMKQALGDGSGNARLSDIRNRVAEYYEQISKNAMGRKLHEAGNAGGSEAELVFEARGERTGKYGLKTDAVQGATLALSVIGIHTMCAFVKDLRDEKLWTYTPDEIKGAFAALRTRLDDRNSNHAFNLEAMTSDEADLMEGSHVQRLRRDYKALIDAFQTCKTKQEIREAAETLYLFGLAHKLRGRAEAAIAMKAAKRTFREKLDKAICKETDSKRDPLQLVRAGLNTGYAEMMGTDAVVMDDPNSLLSDTMKEKLSVITKMVALGVFRTIVPSMSFNKFVEALKDPKSEAYALSAGRIGVALADAEFEKKDNFGGVPLGERYRPLAKGAEKGVASEKSMALARHFVREFATEASQTKPPKQWLEENAGSQQSDFAVSQSLLRKEFGKETAAADKALRVGEMIGNLTERVAKDSVLHISGYVGGTIGASATLAEMTGRIDLGLAIENDLSVEHSADDRWSVYVGG
ncbi:MAG: hypothetical protein LBO81_01185, partial [Clostridiales Family XIII bacterium]|nr:hypothetical protein [Clostridiales Family XIII bacterium]